MAKYISRKTVAIIIASFVAILVFIGIYAAVYANNTTALWLYHDGQRTWYENRRVIIIIDDIEMEDFDVPPIILNNRTFVPVRNLFEEIGGIVEWCDNERSVCIVFGDDVLTMQIGSYVFYVNGEPNEMNVSPMIVNGATLVPARFTAEALGFEVDWCEEDFAVLINTSVLPGLQPTASPTTPPNDSVFVVNDRTSNMIYGQTHPNTVITAVEITEAGIIIRANSPISSVNRRLLDDMRFFIDVYGAFISVPREIIVNTPYLWRVRTSQFSATPLVSRIVFDFIGEVDFTVALSEDRMELVVTFIRENDADVQCAEYNGNENEIEQEVPYENAIDTNGQEEVPATHTPLPLPDNHPGTAQMVELIEWQTIAVKRPPVQLYLAEIQLVDNYLNLSYTFVLPGDFSRYILLGTQNFTGGPIRSITVTNRDGNTEITVVADGIFAYIVSYDYEHIYFTAVHPSEKYDFIVVLDPGHGGNNRGAGGRYGHHGLFESILVLDVTKRVIDLLEADGTVRAFSTRLTDVDPSWDARTGMANNYGDLFVSIHFNAANGFANGTEVLWTSRPNVNPNSISSQAAAQIMQRELVNAIGLVDRGTRRDDPLIVLRNTEIPAILVEPAFMDNPSDAARLHDPEFLQNIAYGIFRGIIEIFEVYTPQR